MVQLLRPALVLGAAAITDTRILSGELRCFRFPFQIMAREWLTPSGRRLIWSWHMDLHPTSFKSIEFKIAPVLNSSFFSRFRFKFICFSPTTITFVWNKCRKVQWPCWQQWVEFAFYFTDKIERWLCWFLNEIQKFISHYSQSTDLEVGPLTTLVSLIVCKSRARDN